MGKVVIKILQGSAVTQTVLGGLTSNYISSGCKFPLVYLYVPKVMKIGWPKLLQKLARLLFLPTL